VGFDRSQKGYIFYAPGSCQLYISRDILFDETFSSAIATTRRLHRDNLALRPVTSDIPMVNTTMEYTGGADNSMPPGADNASIEEGHNHDNDEHHNAPLESNSVDDIDYVPDFMHPDDDSSVSEDEFDDEDDNVSLTDDNIFNVEYPAPIEEPEISPQPIQTTVRRSSRIKKPNPRYATRLEVLNGLNQNKILLPMI